MAERCDVAALEVHEEMEAAEPIKKDFCKQRREEDSHTLQNRWSFHEPGCSFVGRNKAGLVNHTRQKHSRATQGQLEYPNCSRT